MTPQEKLVYGIYDVLLGKDLEDLGIFGVMVPSIE